MIELNNELHGILGKQPITADELTTAQKNETLALPGSWETVDAVSSSIGEIVNFGLPDDYYTTYPAKVHALGIKDLENAAKKVVHPDQLVWVVVGDRSKIEAGLRDLGWGEVKLLNADGEQTK
jgi:zinc protease